MRGDGRTVRQGNTRDKSKKKREEKPPPAMMVAVWVVLTKAHSGSMENTEKVTSTKEVSEAFFLLAQVAMLPHTENKTV